MHITVYQQVDVTGMTDKQIEIVRSRNADLKPNEHAPTCPVLLGASADCVWPLAVCYATNLDGVYNINHELGLTCLSCGKDGLAPEDGRQCARCRKALGGD